VRFLLPFLLLTACSKSPPPPGEDVTVETACDRPDETQIKVKGTFRYPRKLMGFCSTHGGKQSCDMALYASPEKPQDYDVMRPQAEVVELPHLRLSVPVGDAPGEMGALPKSFSDSDVALKLANDTRASDGSEVTLLGKIRVIEGTFEGKPTKTCWLDVAWATP
jgi:hypothetical protein